VAHVYNLTEIAKPVISLTLLPGGSLPENTEIFYRACTSPYVLCKAGDYVSPMSDVQSVTTTPTHRTVKVDFAHYSAAAEYSFLWASPGADPGVGGWNDKITNPQCRSIGEGSLYFYCLDRAKLTTWTDDGSSSGWTNNRYQLGDTSNYAYCPVKESGQARLQVSGGTESDPITFDSIYAEAIAQGWAPLATIEKLEFGSPEFPMQYISGYRLNFMRLDIDAGRTGWFIDRGKIIVVDAGWLYFYGPAKLGSYIEDYDLTLDGVQFILTGHSYAYGRIGVSSSTAEVRFYDCSVRSSRYEGFVATPYLGTVYWSGSNWQIIDFLMKGTIETQGTNTGPRFTSAGEDCLIKRFASARHRYAAEFTAADAFQVEDSNFWSYGGTGPISQQLVSDNVERVFWGMNIVGLEGSGESFYLRRKGATYNYWSKLALINSQVVSFSRVRWYSGAGEPPDPVGTGSYVELRYTVDVSVVDDAGAPVSGATVTVRNANALEEFSTTTDALGAITQQIVTSKRNEPEPGVTVNSYVGGLVTEYGPFTLEISADGFETYGSVFDIEDAVSDVIGLNRAGTAFAGALAVEVGSDALEATVADTALIVTLEEIDADLEARTESVTVNENETEVSE
jgi:hypothetical protein